MVGVEVSSFRDLMTEGRKVVVSSKDIINVSSVGGVVLSRSG
jgi:hypothetical protein